MNLQRAAAPVGTTSDLAVEKTLATAESAGAPATNGQTGGGTIPSTPKLIKTAEMSIEVPNGQFQQKFDAVKKIASDVGGYTTNSSASRTEGEMISGTVTLRVPAKEFDKAIALVKKTGDLDSINITGQDVTEEYVDLESRLKNYEAQEAQLLAIMAQTQTVDEVLRVQEQLTSVRGEIEVIKGRMQYLDKLVDFATITVTVREPGAVVPETGTWGFKDAVRTGLDGLVMMINVIIVLVLSSLPLIILLVLIIWLVRAWLRRKSAKKAGKTEAKK
jgi:hypothetical protein